MALSVTAKNVNSVGPRPSLANKELEGGSKCFGDIFIATVVPRDEDSQAANFIKTFCKDVGNLQDKKHFVEIFFEAIKSSKPAKWQFLSLFRDELYLKPGDSSILLRVNLKQTVCEILNYSFQWFSIY